MATIFVSHASTDNAFAKQLCDDLERIGHTPWIDDLDIRPGESIISAVQDGLSKSRYAIVVLSAGATNSRWVDAEWKEKLWDALVSQKVRVIPVLKDRVEIPLFLRTLSYADFTQSYAVGFAALCLTLRPVRAQIPDVLDRDFLHAIEHAARHHDQDEIRLACLHTVWSCRPDRAKPLLEDALNDWRDVVRIHAQVLLEFY
jgi:hypothetical protein